MLTETQLQPFIDCYTKAIKDAFAIQFMTKVNVVVQTTKSDSAPPTDIASVLEMKGTQINGIVSIMFPSKVFLALYSRVLGEVQTKISPNNADAANEFLNIIYGLARKKINELGHDFLPAIPIVKCGTNLSLAQQSSSSLRVFQCESDLGQFRLELSLKRK